MGVVLIVTNKINLNLRKSRDSVTVSRVRLQPQRQFKSKVNSFTGKPGLAFGDSAV